MTFVFTLLAAAGGLIFLNVVASALLSPDRSIPGPVAARFTRLWYLFKVWEGRVHWDLIALHARHGPVVRYRPNHFSFSDPDALKAIYGHGHEFAKSSWYTAMMLPGIDSMFATTDKQIHADLRRRLQSTYTMSSLVTYEAFADATIDVFCERLRDMARHGRRVDMGWWLQCFAGDTIGMISFGRRFGFLDRGRDQNDLLHSMKRNVDYASLAGIYHRAHPYLVRLINLLSRLGLASQEGRTLFTGYTLDAISQRQRHRDSGTHVSPSDQDQSIPKDFLDKFLDSHASDPQNFSRRHVVGGLLANVAAGSDTTAATLSAILYTLLKNPDKLAKLRREVDSAWTAGHLSSPVTFKQSQDLPYLQAVIHEAMRTFPVVGLPLERVVPPAGASICGRFFPAGAVVGVDSWVLHFNPHVFGPDVWDFRPERWLDESDKDRLAEMRRCWTPFGLGSRTCIGKNISMLEIGKVVPEIIRRFDFELSPELQTREWKTVNHWFVMPQDFELTVKARQ